jgi:hypothetical protein
MAWAIAASFWLLTDLTVKIQRDFILEPNLLARISGGILIWSWAMRAKHKLFARPQPPFDLDQATD